MQDHLYAVVMAGGMGTRLWPRSRNSTPKQFLDLVSTQTMLQETVQRIAPLVPLERVLVVVGQDHVTTVLHQVPGLPVDNVVIEPSARNTAPCIGLAATVLLGRDPEAMMAVLPSDHYIADTAGFRRAIEAAAWLAAGGYLVTLGIQPTEPNTGYGYIQRGSPLPEVQGLPAFEVERFTEKPDELTARRFVASGEYYWNAGIFVWQARRILAEIDALLPHLGSELQALATAWNTPAREEILAEAWDRVPRTSIDYAVMEKASRVAVLPVDIGWDDVGNWHTLTRLLAQDEDENLVHGPDPHILVDTAGTYVYAGGQRLVAVVGLEGFVIIDTPKALLVCPKSRAQEVKEVVEALRARGLEEYL